MVTRARRGERKTSTSGDCWTSRVRQAFANAVRHAVPPTAICGHAISRGAATTSATNTSRVIARVSQGDTAVATVAATAVRSNTVVTRNASSTAGVRLTAARQAFRADAGARADRTAPTMAIVAAVIPNAFPRTSSTPAATTTASQVGPGSTVLKLPLTIASAPRPPNTTTTMPASNAEATTGTARASAGTVPRNASAPAGGGPNSFLAADSWCSASPVCASCIVWFPLVSDVPPSCQAAPCRPPVIR